MRSVFSKLKIALIGIAIALIVLPVPPGWIRGMSDSSGRTADVEVKVFENSKPADIETVRR